MSEHAPSTTDSPKQRLNPAAMRVADAARALSRLSGERITPEMIHADIDDGAPADTSGGDVTINLVHYAAWLIREMGHGATT